MRSRQFYPIPSTSALVAFESVARHGSFSRASRELRTSQPAMSRHVASLERHVSARLFERSSRGASLTHAGQVYLNAVALGLGALRAGAADVAEHSGKTVAEVSIGCSPETAHVFVRPRRDTLRRALGGNVELRIVERSGEALADPAGDRDADVMLTWARAEVEPDERVVAAAEAVGPYCSRAYASSHAEALSGPVSEWSGLTFLDCAEPDGRRVSWRRWFRVAGRPAGRLRYTDFGRHLDAIEAAIGSRGLVLGWRDRMERHVQRGLLVAVGGGHVETSRRLHAVLTHKGRHRRLARACLGFFDRPA